MRISNGSPVLTEATRGPAFLLVKIARSQIRPANSSYYGSTLIGTMKSILYTLNTDAGTFWIRPEPADRVQLGIDKIELKTYSSPRAAARAVAERTTGWQAWDESAAAAPSGLEKWKRGDGHRRGRKHAHKKEVDRLADTAKQDLNDHT